MADKILIGTLHSGENEYGQCLNSLKRQSHSKWDHFVLSGLPNKEAHDQLYSEFMRAGCEYDLFLKFDADMVFRHSDALKQVVELFSNIPDMDHAEFAVADWFSGSNIMGVHVFTNRAKWEKDINNLFVDYCPIIPGVKRNFYDGIAPFVDHSPNPSPFQAYHFGVHRALKVFQFNEPEFRPRQAKFQWQLLKNVWLNFQKTKDRRLGFVALGVEHVMSGDIERRHYDYTNPALRGNFSNYEDMNTSEIFSVLKYKWAPIVRELRKGYMDMRRGRFKCK